MEESGYSGTPLPKKLGLKPEFAALFVGLPPELDYLTADLPDASKATSLDEANGSGLDYLHVFETERARLEDHALRLKAMLKSTGMLWISGLIGVVDDFETALISPPSPSPPSVMAMSCPIRNGACWQRSKASTTSS
jgi:hypothetical protein